MTTSKSLFRRYKWDDLKEGEKQALTDVMAIAGMRAGVGVGVVLTAAAFLTNGKEPGDP